MQTKQTFRYPEDLESNIEIIRRLQMKSQIKNTAIIHAVEIASAYIRKVIEKHAINDPKKIQEIIESQLNVTLYKKSKNRI